jgi:orotate phosphoribosyltransferase-like protein
LKETKKNGPDYDAAAAHEFEQNIKNDWSEYWKGHWQNYYSNKHMDNLVKSLEVKIAQITTEKEELLDENINLGEMVENLKSKLYESIQTLKALNREHNELSQNKGFFKSNFKLIQAKHANIKLREENQELKTRHKWVGLAPIAQEIIEKMIMLKNTGHGISEIARRLNISKSTVSTYLNKPENAKRLQAETAKSTQATSEGNTIRIEYVN